MMRPLSIFLIIISLLQSCYTYQSQPTQLSKTVNTGRVKIEQESGQEIVVKNIMLNDDAYYAKYHGEFIEIDSLVSRKYYPLDIKKTKAKQNVLVVGAVLIPLAGLAVIITIIFKCADRPPNYCN